MASIISVLTFLVQVILALTFPAILYGVHMYRVKQLEKLKIQDKQREPSYYYVPRPADPDPQGIVSLTLGTGSNVIGSVPVRKMDWQLLGDIENGDGMKLVVPPMQG